jgi:hypothetical protein
MRYLIIFLLILTTGLKAQSPLCASRPTSFCCEYVASVTINGKTYNGSTGYTSGSGGSPAGYYDYTSNAVPTITAGQSISISYTAQTNGNYMEYFKLWIDFNGNGVLTDAGELIHSSNYSWTGTKTITATFTVPTTVYNGAVYMRFVMQYSGSPVICGTYAYGNTFDFKTTITGATDPFSYTGYIYGSNGMGIVGVPVSLYSKLKASTTYVLESTVNTNAAGKYALSSTKDTVSYNFQMRISTLSIPAPLTTDAISFNQVLFNPSIVSKDYYRMDVNNNNLFTITDIYLIYMKIKGSGWKSGVPDYRIFTPAEWAVINSSTSNLKTTYSGVQTMTLSWIPNKGSSNYYLIRTGYLN